MSELRAVLFDLDGTLADTAADLAAPINAMRLARGMGELPLEALRPHASAGARGLIGRGFGISPQDSEFARLRDEFLDRYEGALCVHTRVFEGMTEVLSHVETTGLAWGIVSNKVERFLLPIVERLGLAQRSAATIGGDTAHAPKPDPAPLLLAARRIGLSPAQCLYVGDDPRDIIAGQAAGMRTVAAAYGYCGDAPAPQQWNADYLIEHPLELLELLRPNRATGRSRPDQSSR